MRERGGEGKEKIKQSCEQTRSAIEKSAIPHNSAKSRLSKKKKKGRKKEGRKEGRKEGKKERK